MPSSKVEWGSVRVLTQARAWPVADRPRRAAVSSFGVSGTNAHLILEQAEPEPLRRDPVDAGVLPYPLSARNDVGVREQARRLREHLKRHPEADLGDVSHSLATTRTMFPHRAVLVAADRDELDELLGACAVGEPRGAVVTGKAISTGRPVWVFPGQGSQWVGMAVELVGSSPVFAERLGECADALAPLVEWSLVDVLGDEVALSRVDVV
ncbi:ketoacyl-synthetase C-terminal extension domain-containing protein, partial [Streptomyces violaceusniger]|uniref:ketoacyl-synthetase C-terminal extension domain-containing protein n=1 Tax=Streptomyces violaceusniger TaxID=68280 RepID=UPI0031D28014